MVGGRQFMLLLHSETLKFNKVLKCVFMESAMLRSIASKVCRAHENSVLAAHYRGFAELSEEIRVQIKTTPAGISPLVCTLCASMLGCAQIQLGQRVRRLSVHFTSTRQGDSASHADVGW